MMLRGWRVLGVMLLTQSAFAALETAKPADAFVDSIGVNSHYGNSIFVGGNAYANPALDAKLGALGIRHLRDHTYNDEGLARVDSIYAAYGVRASLILGETTRSPSDLVNLLKAHPAYEGIEGLNEPDFNTRSYGGFTDNPGAHNFSATRAFQNDLYNAVKADPLVQNRSILSPAMGTSANSQYLVPIGFDQASMHSYPSGREPTFNLDSNITAMSTLRGTPAPKPLAATETGYYNLPAADTGSIPENISGKYLPRLYAEYFNRGIARQNEPCKKCLGLFLGQRRAVLQARIHRGAQLGVEAGHILVPNRISDRVKPRTMFRHQRQRQAQQLRAALAGFVIPHNPSPPKTTHDSHETCNGPRSMMH